MITLTDVYSSIEKVTLLTAQVKRDMFALYNKYYDAMSGDLFLKDLSDKQWVVILRDQSGQLKGFTTVTMWQRRIEGQPIGVIFSGDTIVESENWGQQALASAWFRLAASIIRIMNKLISFLAQNPGAGQCQEIH